MKKQYTKPEVDLIRFEDVITASGVTEEIQENNTTRSVQDALEQGGTN